MAVTNIMEITPIQSNANIQDTTRPPGQVSYRDAMPKASDLNKYLQTNQNKLKNTQDVYTGTAQNLDQTYTNKLNENIFSTKKTSWRDVLPKAPDVNKYSNTQQKNLIAKNNQTQQNNALNNNVQNAANNNFTQSLIAQYNTQKVNQEINPINQKI